MSCNLLLCLRLNKEVFKLGMAGAPTDNSTVYLCVSPQPHLFTPLSCNSKYVFRSSRWVLSCYNEWVFSLKTRPFVDGLICLQGTFLVTLCMVKAHKVCVPNITPFPMGPGQKQCATQGIGCHLGQSQHAGLSQWTQIRVCVPALFRLLIPVAGSVSQGLPQIAPYSLYSNQSLDTSSALCREWGAIWDK